MKRLPASPMAHRSPWLNLKEKRPRGLLLLFGVGLILIFWFGNRGLNEPDEGRYAQVALEFLEPQAGWWDPQMSDFGHYDKPPLIYWLTALSFHWFGLNEWAARARRCWVRCSPWSV